MTTGRRAVAWCAGLLLAAALFGISPYLYASRANNYFFNTAIDYPTGGMAEHLAIAAWGDYYPPLFQFYLVTGVVLLDLRYPGAVLLSLPLALLAAVYLVLIGSALGRQTEGLAAAWVFLVLPGTAMAMSSTVRDFPVTPCVVGTVFHILRSQGFRHRGHAAAAGLFIGLGLLAKWTYPIYPWASSLSSSSTCVVGRLCSTALRTRLTCAAHPGPVSPLPPR